MPPALSLQEVLHIAALSRLRLTDEQADAYRTQLASVLDHISRLNELDVEGVEPLAHPLEITNRLADDKIEPAMPVEALLRIAPATEGSFLAVPKVLGGDSQA